jgi:hypothetical protein
MLCNSNATPVAGSTSDLWVANVGDVLLTSRRRRISFSGSLLFLGFASGTFFAAVHALAQKALTIGGVVVALLSGGLFLFVLSEFRFAWMNARGRIFVRTLFGKDAVDSKVCAFGISAYAGSKGTTYTVYATDGTSRAEFAQYLTKGGAQRGRRRLEACFGVESHEPERRVAKARVDAERERFEANAAAAKSQVDAYYASGAFHRVGYWAVGFVVLYLLAVSLFVWLTGSHL